MYKIICADDDPITRKMYEFVFGKAQYHTRVFADGDEALEAFLEHPADLVVLDLEMRSMSGLQVCRLLREVCIGEHVPILIVSATNTSECVAKAKHAGATGFIQKPFSTSDLLRRTRSLLRCYDLFRKMMKERPHQDYQTIRNLLGMSDFEESHSEFWDESSRQN